MNGSKNQMKILGVSVDFPYQNIYPSQRAIIANAIKAFQNQENALLESPTGTGKALALLASSLAYQQYVANQKIPFSFSRSSMSQSFDQVRPNDTFSIFSNSESLAEPVSDPVQFKYQKPRIWFTTRTHTQLKQLIGEYKKLPYNPTMVVLGGRKHLCLNKKVLKSNDMDGECRKAMEEHKCPFLMKSGIPPEFRSGGKYEKFDIEDMVEYGKAHLRCPYHMSLVILSKADLVFCPYNYVLDPVIKGLLELSLVGSILIIDEAHNVENVCREAGSFRATFDDLSFSTMFLKKLKENFLPEDPDFISLIAVIDFMTDVSKWFNSHIAGMKFLKQKEQIENVNNVLKEWGLTQDKWPLLERRMAAIITRKVRVVDVPNEEPHFELPLRVLQLLQNIFIFLVLVFKDNMENINDFQIPLVVGDRDNGTEDLMIVSCLNPGVVFKCVSREVHSLVLASGTLSPLSTFSNELKTSFPVQISANHIIGTDQVASYIITNALDGTPFNSSFQNLNSNKDNILIGLAKLFETLLPEIPGGALLFLPSYAFLRDLTIFWKRNGMWKTINSIKPIFLEEKNKVEDTYLKYQTSINRGNGGFLIGVCRGNMSEGMDFADDQARAVFLFGIPYPAFKDIEVQLKRNYNDKTEGCISGSEWYEAQAFRGVFQAIGRCIRHQNDYGSVVLIDQRIPNFLDKFPRWVKQSFVDHVGISDIKMKMKSFYQQMEKKFPKKVLFTRGQSIAFSCAHCGELVADIKSLDVDEAEQTRKTGFLKFTEAGNNINCLFISRNTKKKLFVQPSPEILWSQDDLIAYNLIKCQCGSKLGLFIVSATRNDSSYIDGIMLLLSRLSIINEISSINKSPKTQKKTQKKAETGVKGQKTLKF